jgi:hypothetical protein
MSASADIPPDAAPEPAEPVAGFPSGTPLRISKGHAGPEELAALTVILCARLAHLRDAAGPAEPESPAASHHSSAARPACWSGCWTCG